MKNMLGESAEAPLKDPVEEHKEEKEALSFTELRYGKH